MNLLRRLAGSRAYRFVGAWCLDDDNTRACIAFLKAAVWAQRATNMIFGDDGPRRPTNAYTGDTKANAFKHAFWNALMTMIAIRDGAGGITVNQVRTFAYKYEKGYLVDYANPRNLRERHFRREARMDVHNNRIGQRYAFENHERGVEYMCRAMLSKARHGVRRGERARSVRRRLYWLRASRGTPVRDEFACFDVEVWGQDVPIQDIPRYLTP